MWPILRNFVMVLCAMAVAVIAIRDYTLLFDILPFDGPMTENAAIPTKITVQTAGKSKLTPGLTDISGLTPTSTGEQRGFWSIRGPVWSVSASKPPNGLVSMKLYWISTPAREPPMVWSKSPW